MSEAVAVETTWGPQPGVSYPLKVHYCGECSLPVEYCENGPHPEKCKLWMEKNLPELVEKLQTDEDSKEGDKSDGAAGDEKKRQKRGGKSAAKPVKKTSGPQRISLSRAPRGRNKFVTVVTGLGTYDIDLKAASKFFAQKFACGSSLTGADEIVVQGDVKDDLMDLLSEKWPQIDDDTIEDLGDLKR